MTTATRTPAPPRPWSGWKVAMLLGAGLLVPSITGGLLRPVVGDAEAAATMAGSVVAIVAVVVVAGRSGLPGRSLGLARPPRRWLPRTVGLGILLLGVNVALGLLAQAIGAGALVGRSAAASGLAAGTPAMAALLLLYAAVLAPIEEELLFRGVLQGGLSARFGVHVGLPIAAVAFLAAHGAGMGAFHLVAGFAYGWLAHRAGSIWPAVVAHATNNAAVVVLASL